MFTQCNSAHALALLSRARGLVLAARLGTPTCKARPQRLLRSFIGSFFLLIRLQQLPLAQLLGLGVAPVPEAGEPYIEAAEDWRSHNCAESHQGGRPERVAPVQRLIDGTLLQRRRWTRLAFRATDLREVVDHCPNGISPAQERSPTDLSDGEGEAAEEESQVEQDHISTVHEKTHVGDSWRREGLRRVIQSSRQDGKWQHHADQHYHDFHKDRDRVRWGVDTEPLGAPHGHGKVEDFLNDFQSSDPARQVDPVQPAVLRPPGDEVDQGMSHQENSHYATEDDESLVTIIQKPRYLLNIPIV